MKSKRGIIFRKWATSILKQYLLNGYAINNDRLLAYQSNILRLEANCINIENRIKNIEQTIYADNNLIIFEGEILKPYSFLINLFFLAKEQFLYIHLHHHI
ncbi:MAG: RhuM family protein [Anaeroplasmataceae bacterium]